MLFQLPSGCRTFVAIHPSNKWGWAEVLQNKANYLLEILAWQKANEGVKKSQQTEKPTLFVPDFMKDKSHLAEVETYDTSEIDAILKRPRA